MSGFRLCFCESWFVLVSVLVSLFSHFKVLLKEIKNMPSIELRHEWSLLWPLHLSSESNQFVMMWTSLGCTWITVFPSLHLHLGQVKRFIACSSLYIMTHKKNREKKKKRQNNSQGQKVNRNIWCFLSGTLVSKKMR